MARLIRANRVGGRAFPAEDFVVTKRRRPFWFWAVVAIGLGALYPASFGPVAWANAKWGVYPDAITVVYRPLFRGLRRVNLEVLGVRYAEAGCLEGWPFMWDDQRGPMWGAGRSGPVILMARRPSMKALEASRKRYEKAESVAQQKRLNRSAKLGDGAR